MYLHPAMARALGEETRAEHLRRAGRLTARRKSRSRFRRAASGARSASAVPAVTVRDGPPPARPVGPPAGPAVRA